MIQVRYLKIFFRRPSLAKLLHGAFFLFFLAGCASASPFNKLACRNNIDDQIAGLNLQRYFESIAGDLCRDMCSTEDCSNATILATNFVNVQTLVPGKSGLLMGELMSSNLNNVCGYNVVQVEFSRLFKLSEGGLITMTRNPTNLQRTEYAVKNCVVGSYSATPNKLYLFAKIINTWTGKIIKMTSREVDLSCK